MTVIISIEFRHSKCLVHWRNLEYTAMICFLAAG